MKAKLTAGALAVAGATYWRHMSSYSQAIGPFPFRGDTSGAFNVALTFDDGPNEPFTSRIAGVLAERGVLATFFQVGRCVQRHPGVTRDLQAAGHVIGNHSYSHSFTAGWSRARVRDEVAAAQEVLAGELGRRPRLYRPPWLIRTAGLYPALAAEGLVPVSGTFCHPLEPIQPPARRIANRALAGVRPGGFVIFHDGFDDRGADRSRSVEAVRIVVDTLLERGVVFGTVDQMLGVNAYGPPARA